MAITLQGNKYLLDIWPAGRNGPRIRRKYDTRKEAKLREAEFISLYAKAPEEFERDKRKLSALVKLWYQLYGSTLKDHKYRYARTLALCERLGDPLVYKFSARDFARYREIQLKEGKSKSTLNHELRYLRAVFSELIRLDYFKGVNPLSKIRTYKLPQSEMTFLTIDQINLLLDECKKSTNSHLYPVVLLSLATGARISEANSVKRKDLLSDRVVFPDTKNSKNRVVPVKPSLIRYLKLKAFPAPQQKLFASCKGAFRSALKRSGIELPKGQLTHVMRHTFASHFVMNGGSLKVLQELLGHQDIKTTMIYAHLTPDYLESVLDLGIYSEIRR
jgi:site-specific recombinase XerD